MVDNDASRRRWIGWHILAVVAFLVAPAAGDALTQDRAFLPPVLSQTRALYSYVPSTLASESWAEREMHALRTVQRPVRYAEASTVDVFSDTGVMGEGGTDQIDPFDTLTIGAETAGGNGTMAAMGDAAFGAALSDWGLSMADMQGQLPELALAVGSYIDYLNDTSIKLVKRLRELLLGNATLKGTPALDRLGSRGDASVAAGRGEQSDEAKRREDLQTTKRVVRSVFKIILGFLLGVLLWMLVSRM